MVMVAEAARRYAARRYVAACLAIRHAAYPSEAFTAAVAEAGEAYHALVRAVEDDPNAGRCADCRAYEAEHARILTVVRSYLRAYDAFFCGPRYDSDDYRHELNVAENRLMALVRTQRSDGSWEPLEGEGKP